MRATLLEWLLGVPYGLKRHDPTVFTKRTNGIGSWHQEHDIVIGRN